MHITLRGLRVVHVGIIYPILGKVLFQITFTNYENILAHNTSLVTSGNSGLPRLNSSRKSTDIPLPTQSPIWVNPMGPITLTFGKKCYSVTTPGDNLQISSTKVLSLNACSYHAGSGHCIRDISLIWLIADRYSCQLNLFSAECTCRLRGVLSMTLLRCAVWRKQAPVCRGPNASNPARGRTLPGQERPSNGRPDASQRRPRSMLCPVGLPGALSVDIVALLPYWPTYAPITVRLTSDTHVLAWSAPSHYLN